MGYFLFYLVFLLSGKLAYANQALGLADGSYQLVDFLTGEEQDVYHPKNGVLRLHVPSKDAVVYKLISTMKAD